MSRAGVVAAVLGALACAGCVRSCACGDDAQLAQLVEVQGSGVERDFARSVGAWRAAEVGERFELGDGVRAGSQAAALLKLRDGATARLKPGTLLRFVAGKRDSGGEEQGLDVEMGEAELSAGSAELRVRTELGLAVMPAGSKVSLQRAGKERIVYRVELGSARLVGAGGERTVARGEVVEVGIGMAIVERGKAGAGAAGKKEEAKEKEAESAIAEVSATNTVATAATAEEQAVTLAKTESAGATGPAIPEGAAQASVGVPLGESFTLHAGRVPVMVAFDAGTKCPGEVAIVLDGKPRARGRGAVSVAVPAGKHAYAAHCLDERGALGEAVGEGSVTALRDPGTAKLPRRPATSYIDADGKSYTVLYQNLLPKIVLTWPRAPASDGYKVEVDSPSGTKSFTERKPEHGFAAGALAEGKHTLRFMTAAGESSKPTTLEIRFDNAAPKASVSAPRDLGFAPGGSVEVAGVALPGWEVSVQNGTLALDDQHRFSGTATTSATRPDLALRITSPRGGVHYYVRRAAGAR